LNTAYPLPSDTAYPVLYPIQRIHSTNQYEETAKYGKIWNDEDIHDLRSVETEFLAIAFNDEVSSKTLTYEPTVSSLNDKIDFRVSFDDSDDEDYTVIFQKNSFSYKIISAKDLKTDSENNNEKVMPSLPPREPAISCFDDLDFFKDFENEFPTIFYNDALTSKSDLLTESILNPQHIKEFDLKNETSLSGYDEEEQSVLPSSSNPIPNSILEGSGGNHGAWIKSLSMKKRLARKKKMESVSKQGRKTFKSIPTVHKDPAFDDLDDAMDYMETEDAHDEGTVKDSEGTRVSTEDQVSTDKPNEGTAEPKDGNSDESAAPTTVFRDDETIAQFLVTMSQNKTKQKGVEIKEIKDTDRPRTTTERSILTLKPLPKIDPKDKGKKVLEEKAKSDAESEGVNEAKKKFKMLANDEEIAIKVQEEWEAEEEKKKLAKKEATKVAFTNEYDFIQARLNADKILAEKLQEEEREKFSIEQRAKFLHDIIAAQRRFLAQQRSKAIRNKLPTKNQLRNQMMTYLKYVGGYRHAQLNKKKFEEIQMNEKAAGIDKEEVSEEPKSTKVKSKIEEPKENNRKTLGRRLKMKAPKRSKRQKTDYDHEEENQLRTFLKIVPEEEQKIDYEVLGTRVFRADGSSGWIKTFSELIKFFDRMDMVEIHSLKNQEEWKLQRWIFYENYGVYVLRLEDGTQINMLAKRRYPFTKNILESMMDLRLIDVSDDDTIFDLLRFIEQHIDEFGGQDGIQKKTAFGKDKLNPLIVDSLLKTIRLSIHLVVYNEELAIPEQTATEGKLKENQGCRVDTDQVHQNGDLKNRSVWIHPPGLQDVYTKET
ncbi:hypothetical protein Tco_0935884, partial [Tanacetum coccineum]